MSLYYDHGGIQIHLGDCREILPQLGRFDLLLTDPPYGIGRDGQTQSNGAHGGRRAYETHSNWDDVPPCAGDFLLMFNASKDQVIWGANYFAPHLKPSMGWLVWNKEQRINQSDGELAYTSRDAALRIFDANRVILMGDGAYHPTQKPVALMKWCISLFPEVKTILDPYCGSGTSLVAAKEMGLTAVGIELHEQYAETCAKRLSQEVFAW